MRRFMLLFVGLALAILAPFTLVQGAGIVGDDQADAVWGQPTLFSGTCTATTATNLCFAYQAAVDAAGRLWVADYQQNRVLMYPAGSATASKVFGQPNLTSNLGNNGGLDASAINAPVGLAIDKN